MKRLSSGLLAAAAALIIAPAAIAASDYLLEIDGVEGEAAASIEISSWSWGASNTGSVTAPRDAASGMASGRRQSGPSVTASQNTQSLRESPTRASTGQTSARGASSANSDLMSAAALDEIQGFSLTFDKSSPVLAKVCSGKHFTSVQLRGRGDTFVLENAAVTGCASSSDTAACVSSVGMAGGGAGGGAAAASYAATGRSSAPSQCPSPNPSASSPRQTQGATFGEKVNQGLHAAGSAVASGVTLTFTGQLKHTKTGHVTLLK